MPITESDLRDLLDQDSADVPHAGVTVADVRRRVRRIRRRRLAALASVAAAALVVAGVNVLPRTVTAEVPEDIWAGVMAQPTSSAPPLYYRGAQLAEARSAVGGVRQRFSYPAIHEPVLIAVDCVEDTSYAIVWVSGVVFGNDFCGAVAERPIMAGLIDDSGRLMANGLDIEVLIVPLEMVDHRTNGMMSLAQTEALAKAVKPYQVHWSLVISSLKKAN